MTWGRRRDDRGATTEMVILTPAILLLMNFIVFAGRFVDARSDVISSAKDGARAASIQRNEPAARSIAEQTIHATLESESIECDGGEDIDVAFEPDGAFEPGNFVVVEVSCGVEYSDLSFLTVPAAVTTQTYTAIEVIDEHRGDG